MSKKIISLEESILESTNPKYLTTVCQTAEAKTLMGKTGSHWTPVEKHLAEVFKDDLKTLQTLLVRSPKGVADRVSENRCGKKIQEVKVKIAKRDDLLFQNSNIDSDIKKLKSELERLYKIKEKLESELGLDLFN
ncbi:MAG: hypothetical protein ABIP51_05065 [Bacteroidia bacterium]